MKFNRKAQTHRRQKSFQNHSTNLINPTSHTCIHKIKQKDILSNLVRTRETILRSLCFLEIESVVSHLLSCSVVWDLYWAINSLNNSRLLIKSHIFFWEIKFLTRWTDVRWWWSLQKENHIFITKADAFIFCLFVVVLTFLNHSFWTFQFFKELSNFHAVSSCYDH